MFSSTQAQSLGYFLPAKEPSCQVAGFLGVTPIVKPAQFHQAVVGDLAGQVVERIAQEMHITALPISLRNDFHNRPFEP